MAIIRIREFGGIVPKLDEKLLPENAAVEAINVDLQGQGIEPLYGPSFTRNAQSTFHGLTPPNATATVAQLPTACLSTLGETSAPAYISVTPQSGNYVVQANDVLIYSVFLPAGTTLAGQGGVDLHFTDATTLGNVNDQNTIGSLTGDITARAQGTWYLRRISLATVVGKTIDELRFYHNYNSVTPLAAYFGAAWVMNGEPATLKSVLFDVDHQDAGVPSSTTGSMQSVLDVIDEDDAALVGTRDNPANVEADAVLSIVPVQFDGPARSIALVVQGYPQNKRNYPIKGWAAMDRLVPFGTSSGVTPTLPFPSGGLAECGFSWRSFMSVLPPPGANDPAIGWPAVSAPTAAMSLAVVGGAAPTVTRSYVYTRVSEYGLESGPSPAVTVTGNRDGTWQLTNITAWSGTSIFSKVRSPQKKRVYRTPEGSDTYRFVAEIAAGVTTLNDLALDAALGEELPTENYLGPPAQLNHAASWINGMVGAIAGTQVCFCEPYQYHAWPLDGRYTIPYVGVAVGSFGDRFVALTKSKPIAFTGQAPNQLVSSEFEQGEACLGPKAVISADIGVIYPGKTGWALIDYGGVQNMTREYLTPGDYAAVVSVDTVACFDNRKLHWITQGATQGYSFEPGAGPRALTKFQVPDPIYAMSYYGARDTRWIAYVNSSSLKIGKLFPPSGSKLKWTWKSKLLRFPSPASLKVAQVDSNEWDTLSASMKAREAAYKTGGGGAPYTIDISGLTQAEAWCYLKVWCEADKGADKVLVFDDFVVSDRPVRLARAMKSDCWQFELRGNMAISSIALAESERELNAE